MRFQQERTRAALAGALETMDPRRHDQRRPDLPWRSPCQETPAFLCRQLGDTFQIQIDAGFERRNDRLERFVVDGDVEVRADGVPPLAASVGVTLQGLHVISAALPAASETRVLDFPEAWTGHGGSSWLMA